ncbi:MAG: hypothetical protein WBD72_06320, partial [Candidatus Acidiferrum sp.]
IILSGRAGDFARKNGEIAFLGHVSSLADEFRGTSNDLREKQKQIEVNPKKVRRQQNISTYLINL